MRTTHARQRARERFWTEHGEKFRLALIGGGMVLAVSAVAQFVLR